MKIGIVSDTHGRDERLREGLKQLLSQGAEIVVHCGDIGQECLLALSELSVPTYAVAGNIDQANLEGILALARAGNVTFGQDMVVVSLGSQGNLAATHGNKADLLHELVSGGYSYVCHGHSHLRRNERIGRTRVINPGALHQSASFTVALLDTASDMVEFLPVP